MADEYHVASFVLHTRAEDVATTAAEIARLPGVEVHAQAKGKLVVTAEASNVRELAAVAEQLGEAENVLSVAPVYHQFTSESASEETAANEHQ